MAEQFLSQDEVDALLVGVNGEELPSEESQPAEGVVPYDLALQERIVRGRMPTLEIINDRFARNMRVGLFNFMRRNPEISVGPVKVQKYSAFLSNLVVPTNLNIMQVKPLRGSGLLILEPQLVFAVIDTLFGGSGRLQTRIEGRSRPEPPNSVSITANTSWGSRISRRSEEHTSELQSRPHLVCRLI